MTSDGGPVNRSPAREAERLRPDRPETEWATTLPAIDVLLLMLPIRRLAESRQSDEAKILARTLCLLPRRTEKIEKK